jgi:hypothetical protein
MLLTRWTAVRQGRFAGKPFLVMLPKSGLSDLKYRFGE